MPGCSDGVYLGLTGMLALGFLLTVAVLPDQAGAQIISPGRLSRAHQPLEGMGNCTQCHQLRTRGVEPDRCLDCHQALRSRIDKQRGYHGQLQEEGCGACHKEHLGQDFAVVRMDPDTFPHTEVGYELRGSHAEIECRSCHAPVFIADTVLLQELSESGGSAERTFLGLSTRCASCHEADDPHEGQFRDRDCATCHTEVDWARADVFDHAQTDYPLDGRHEEVKCEGCHNTVQRRASGASIRYAPVDSRDCVSCHENVHEPAMSGRCGGCHKTAGWFVLNKASVESGFDHDVTGFPLAGAHLDAGCRACHSQTSRAAEGIRLRFLPETEARSYPRPGHDTCNSCHLDFHEGVFGDRSCELCHGSASWDPPDYPRARHQMELRFPLNGAHAVTPCSACHEDGSGGQRRLVFRFQDPESCSSCHSQEDPHESAFGSSGCELCHQPVDFLMDRFEHALLEDAGWSGVCVACHDEDDPHGDQFGTRDCQECHDTDAFAVPDFDHSTTRYVLDGAHAEVPCTACHLAEHSPLGGVIIRYRPVEATCEACHGGRR